MRQPINFLLIGAVLSTFFAFASPAIAQTAKADKAIGVRSSYDHCIDRSGDTTPAMRDCISTEFGYQDSRIKRVYNRLLASLNQSEQEQLRQSQQAWHTTMMAYCDAGPEPGQGQELSAYSCSLEETTKRAAIFEYMEHSMKNE